AEKSFVRVVDVDVTKAAAKLERMRAHLFRSEIIQLPTLALIDGLTNLRAARIERAAHIQRRNVVVAALLVATERILKASLVNGGRVEYRGFRHLHVLICRERVEAAL